MSQLPSIPEHKQKCLFPEKEADQPWTDENYVRRYYLNFPFYPFRTLCPRDLNTMALASSTNKSFDYNPTSPLFPANTQINLVFKKRNTDNFLNYMLPFMLNQTLGTKALRLTQNEKKEATKFSVTTRGAGAAAATTKTFIITKVEIDVKNVYLQVH